MRLPKVLRQLGSMSLQALGAPRLVGRQRNLLWLSRAVGPCPRFRQVLLVMVLAVVEDGGEVGRRLDLSRDRAAPLATSLQRGLVSSLAGLVKPFLLLRKPISCESGKSMTRQARIGAKSPLLGFYLLFAGQASSSK